MENKNSQPDSSVNFNQLFKLLLMVVVILCLLFVAYKLMNTKKVAEVPQLVNVEKTDVEISKLPEKFPSNIPLEEGAEVIQNYNSETPEGQFQATRQFETKKSLAENYALYTDFMKKNGWEIKATTDDPTYKMVMGNLLKKAIQVTIEENKINQVKIVTISYTENK